MGKKLYKVIFTFLLLFIIPFNVYATTYSDIGSDTDEDLVNKILGEGITATDIVKRGTIYSFSGGFDDFGIESGIILDTSGTTDSSAPNDSDLESLMDYGYGGHTSSLEFTMVAKGNLLNFNYVFASGEFQYGPEYNDVFGLFVSVNGGAYENIAKIIDSNNQEETVSITSLKNNPTLYTAKNIYINSGETDGVSNVFNAQKVVKKGDTVKVKLVIADVSDTSVDSFVLIEGGSLSFDPPSAKLDYEEEMLKGLDPSTTYKIIDGEETYEVISNEEGKVPLVGKDNNNKEYDFIGKTIQVIKKGVGDIPDSDPQDVAISDRPETPNITPLSVTEDSISVQKIEGYEYSIDGGTTWQDEPTFYGLEPNKEYEIISRYSATNESVHGTNTSKIRVRTLEKEPSDLDNATNTNVFIELDNESPIITIRKGKIYEAVEDDSDIQEALENDDKISIKFIVNKVEINEELAEKVGEELEKDEEIAFTVDASIKLFINDVYVKDIKDSSKKIVFKINIPEEYRKSNRKFFVIRTHIGDSGEEYEKLEDIDNDDSTITVESDKFSDFIVAYRDEEIINNPNTGDSVLVSFALLVVSLIGLAGIIFKTKTIKW